MRWWRGLSTGGQADHAVGGLYEGDYGGEPEQCVYWVIDQTLEEEQDEGEQYGRMEIGVKLRGLVLVDFDGLGRRL